MHVFKEGHNQGRKFVFGPQYDPSSSIQRITQHQHKPCWIALFCIIDSLNTSSYLTPKCFEMPLDLFNWVSYAMKIQLIILFWKDFTPKSWITGNVINFINFYNVYHTLYVVHITTIKQFIGVDECLNVSSTNPTWRGAILFDRMIKGKI